MKNIIFMKRISYAAMFVLNFFLSDSIFGASFDCAQAQSKAEKTICASEYLSTLDSIMSDFYAKALSHSLNEKALMAEQKQWWQERNKCNEDTKCLQKSYQARIDELEATYKWMTFKPIEDSFLGGDTKQRGIADTHTDFIAKNNYWDIRPFYVSYSNLRDILEQDYGLKSKKNSSILLTGYRFDKGGLYVYATLSYEDSNQSFLVELTDHLPPKIITEKNSDNDFLVPGTPYKAWLGKCGEDTCYSYHASPNNVWQAATKFNNDAIYLFPNNKPNEGKMIIENFDRNTDKHQKESDKIERNLVWLDDNTLFFDNAMAYAGIWRVDIKQKLVEKILPYRGVKKPFPIKFNNQEYLIFVIHYGYDQSDIYLARPPQKKIETPSN